VDLPSHPDAGDSPSGGGSPGDLPRRAGGATRIVVTVLVAAVVLLVVLHLTGIVGPGRG
jgi:hypothetical protein